MQVLFQMSHPKCTYTYAVLMTRSILTPMHDCQLADRVPKYLPLRAADVPENKHADAITDDGGTEGTLKARNSSTGDARRVRVEPSQCLGA
jgi:hypothetical protein